MPHGQLRIFFDEVPAHQHAAVDVSDAFPIIGICQNFPVSLSSGQSGQRLAGEIGVDVAPGEGCAMSKKSTRSRTTSRRGSSPARVRASRSRISCMVPGTYPIRFPFRPATSPMPSPRRTTRAEHLLPERGRQAPQVPRVRPPVWPGPAWCRSCPDFPPAARTSDPPGW